MIILEEEIITAPIYIEKYNKGKITLNIGEYNYPIILSSTKILEYKDKIFDIESIKVSHLNIILSNNPEVILIGTGEKQLLPPIKIINQISKFNKNINFMTSSYASKIYNLLVNENRNISCLII